MNLWNEAKDNSGWIVSAAAAVAGYLFRRKAGEGSIRERWDTSWIGRRFAAEHDNVRLKADLASLEHSIARREARWAEERSEMEAYALRLRAEVSELGQLVAALRTAQHAGSSPSSAPPSTNSTGSDATSSPPSPRQNE